MDHIVNLEFIGWAKSNTNCNVWGWEYQPFTQRWPGGGGGFSTCSTKYSKQPGYGLGDHIHFQNIECLLFNPKHIDVNNKNKHVSNFLVVFFMCKICFFQCSLCSELLGLTPITFKYIMHLYHLTFAKSGDITLNLIKLWYAYKFIYFGGFFLIRSFLSIYIKYKRNRCCT